MELYLYDPHILFFQLQQRNDDAAFASDGFQPIRRSTEDNLKVLCLEEIQHQFDIMVTHFFEWLIDEEQTDGIDSGIVQHGECRR